MVKHSLILLVFCITIKNGNSQFTAEIRSAKIEFVFGTPYFKGSKTIVFTDSGRIVKETGAEFLDTTVNMGLPKGMFGNRTVIHSLNIQTKDSVYAIDLDSATGYRRSRINWLMSLFPKDEKKNIIRKDTLLNKICDVVDLNGAKIWYWKGIVLKKEFPVPMTDIYYEYATSIDENYIIKDDEFKVPKGIIIYESTANKIILNPGQKPKER